MIGRNTPFVFIHIPKTAGQSVSKALYPYALNRPQRAAQWVARRLGRRSKFDLFGLRPARGHRTAKEYRTYIGSERYLELFKFSFVRNPWDRMYSYYKFVQLRPKFELHKAATSGSFEFFVETALNGGMQSQCEFLCDDDGSLMVDFVGRFEDLAMDFGKVCERLQIAASLPHKNKSGPGAYVDAYTSATKQMIEAAWADDIDRFGYSFSGA